MPAPILDMGCTIMCPHGATATVTPSNTKVKVGGNYAILFSDTMVISGCPFQLPGPTPSPCIRIQWSNQAIKTKINGTPVLLMTSIGICMAATGSPQGPAIVQGVQTKVMGT